MNFRVLKFSGSHNRFPELWEYSQGIFPENLFLTLGLWGNKNKFWENREWESLMDISQIKKSFPLSIFSDHPVRN